MTTFWIEALGLISQLILLGRWYYQLKASKKAKRSVVPVIYWVITIVAQVLFAIYTFLLGSFILPVLSIFTLLFNFYIAQQNISIELSHKK